MSLQYIRNYYRVPAKRFGRIVVDGQPGTIVGARSQYLRVQLDGEKGIATLHPTWHVEYGAPPQETP